MEQSKLHNCRIDITTLHINHRTISWININIFVFRRSLPLDKLSLGPEEGMVIAFVPDFGKTKETLEEEVDEVGE